MVLLHTGKYDLSPVTHAVSLIYLKHVFIQEPSSKHGNTLRADVGVAASEQVKGVQLLTVQVESHRLALHTVGDSVPTGSKDRRRNVLFPKCAMCLRKRGVLHLNSNIFIYDVFTNINIHNIFSH